MRTKRKERISDISAKIFEGIILSALIGALSTLPIIAWIGETAFKRTISPWLPIIGAIALVAVIASFVGMTFHECDPNDMD